jgi:hypothetical protein
MTQCEPVYFPQSFGGLLLAKRLVIPAIVEHAASRVIAASAQI